MTSTFECSKKWGDYRPTSGVTNIIDLTCRQNHRNGNNPQEK